MYEYMDNVEQFGAVGSFAMDKSADFKHATTSLFESIQSSYTLNPLSDLTRILSLDQTKEAYKNALIGDVMESTTFDDPYYAMLPSKLEQLFENTAGELLAESSVAALSPIVGITLPVLKKAYIEGHSKDIIMTEIPKQPIIKMAYERRFLKDLDGNKYYIPDIFYNDDYKAIMSQGMGNPVSDKFYPLDEVDEGGSVTAAKALPIQDFDILGASGGSIRSRDELDHDFGIISVQFDVDGTVYTVPNLNIQPNMAADSTFSARIKAPVKNAEGVTLEDTLFGQVDFYAGKVSVASASGYIKKVQFGGHLSNQNNVNTVELDREREQMEWKIPTGVHLNTGLTVERLRDYKALFNFDLTSEIVSDMSTVLSQTEDSDILGYLSTRFDQVKQQDAALSRFGYTDGFVREGHFSCEPGPNKYVTRSQYIESELKYDLNRFIDELKVLLKVPDIMFVVYGHPNNVTLIQDNVRWVIDEDTKIGGIQLDYRFGVMAANKNRIHVISTLKCPKSRGLRIVAYPLTQETVTFKHFKYSLNIENTYRNAATPLTPNVMATSRYKTIDVLPVQGEFKIYDNEFALKRPASEPTAQVAQPVLAQGATSITVSKADYENGYPVVAYTTTPGAKLYYTVDGETPTAESTEVPATGVITVTSSATVKVVAVKAGMIDSSASAVVVTINE
jgi:hypothetical protein